MPQKPVESTLFVSRIIAGPGVSVTPNAGTGIVTVTADPATLTTTQIGVLSAAQVSGNLASYVAVSTTQVTTQLSTITDNTVFLFGLKTVGGTPGNPTVKTVNKATGTITIASDPGDTSTYNVVGLG